MVPGQEHIGHSSAREIPRASCSAGSRAGPARTNRPRPTAHRPRTPGSSRATASTTASAGSLHPTARSRRSTLRGRQSLAHALVDPFVATAQQHQWLERGEPSRHRLRKPLSLPATAGPRASGTPRDSRIDAIAAKNGSGFITMPGPAAKRHVVDHVMPIGGELAEVVDLRCPPPLGLSPGRRPPRPDPLRSSAGRS